jgi:hypothetical protein
MTTDDASTLLDEALARRIPESRDWVRGQQTFGNPKPGTDFWVEFPPINQKEKQHIVILLRRDGAVQIEWHVTGKRGSPFELFMPCDHDDIAQIIDAASEFIADVLREDVVLAYRNGFWRGGRRFLKIEEIAEARNAADYEWMVSWNGTHTWNR